MGRQVFTAGEILTAANMNDLSDQTVMVFDDSAARDAAIPSPSEGMVTYLKDTDSLEQFTGAAFVPVSQPGILQVVSTAKTDVYTVSLAAGAVDTVNVTGLEVTITPTNSGSKLLIIGSVSVGHSDSRGAYRLIRDGAQSSFVGDTAGSRTRYTSSGRSLDTITSSTSFVFLENANSTSSTTYGIRLGNPSSGTATVTVNQSQTNTDSANFGRFASSITIMEVAG